MDLPDVRIRALPSPADALYPGQEPFVFVTAAETLRSVSVFVHEREHLHYVGQGLREAGFSFELTFRLAGSPPAPAWPVQLMSEFARHAIKAQRPFGPGHYLCLPERVGAVRCGALVPDPELAKIEGGWLQIVGLGEDELFEISEHGHGRALAHRAPYFVTVA